MNIAISLLNFRPGLIGGAETYIRRLIGELPPRAGGDRIALMVYPDIAAAIDTPLEKILVNLTSRQVVRARALEAFTFLRSSKAMRALDMFRPDVTFFPQQSIFPRGVRGHVVLTVLDIQDYFFPQYFSRLDLAFRHRMYPWSMKRAGHIIAISEYTRTTLIERLHLAPETITAVPFGVSGVDPLRITPTDLIAGPYIYYPAATFPHKNHATLLRTFATLKKVGDFPYKLVLTGKQTELWPQLQKLMVQLGITGDVVHPGFLPYSEVQRIYKAAAAIVFPTQFEGFGLPVLEAVEFGKKVITSPLAVFDEIGVPASCQIDFSKPQELRAALAAGGTTRLTKPTLTWADNARITLDILRKAARP